jgi:hypothetical protein
MQQSADHVVGDALRGIHIELNDDSDCEIEASQLPSICSLAVARPGLGANR